MFVGHGKQHPPVFFRRFHILSLSGLSLAAVGQREVFFRPMLPRSLAAIFLSAVEHRGIFCWQLIDTIFVVERWLYLLLLPVFERFRFCIIKQQTKFKSGRVELFCFKSQSVSSLNFYRIWARYKYFKKIHLIIIIKFIKDIGTCLEINIFKFKTMIENKISASYLPWKPTPMLSLRDVLKKS